MRVMTNIPSALGEGASAFAPGSAHDRGRCRAGAQRCSARSAWSSKSTEDQIDAVTALAGSGPAFVYSVIEALAEGGEQEGLPADVALALATQTVLGAAQLAREAAMPRRRSFAAW